MYKLRLINVLIISVIFITNSYSHVTGIVTGLPIPRYVSIKSTEVKMRVGPGKKYQTSYVFRCLNYPLKVIAEFDNWRKVTDINNTQGWIHQSLLSGIKYVLINNNKIIIKKDLEKELLKNQSLIFRAPDENSPPILKVEIGVLAKVVKCEEYWCKINIEKYRGWIRKVNIWGVE